MKRYPRTEESDRIFYSRVEIADDRDCWHWLPTKERNSYGSFSLKGARWRAHHYLLSDEQWDKLLLPKMMACHTCDTPSCVNPNHIFIGTAKDNARDMIAKGRGITREQALHFAMTYGMKARRTRGQERPNARLTDEAVRIIRALPFNVYLQKPLAKKFNVSPTAIRNVQKRRTWNHIHPGDPIEAEKVLQEALAAYELKAKEGV